MIQIPTHPAVELSVLAAIVHDPARLFAAPRLEVADFTTSSNRGLFTAIRNMEAQLLDGIHDIFHAALLERIKHNDGYVLAMCRALIVPVDPNRFVGDVEVLRMGRLARQQITAAVDVAATEEGV